MECSENVKPPPIENIGGYSMKEVKDYRVVEAGTSGDLNKMVRGYLTTGYKLHEMTIAGMVVPAVMRTCFWCGGTEDKAGKRCTICGGAKRILEPDQSAMTKEQCDKFLEWVNDSNLRRTE